MPNANDNSSPPNTTTTEGRAKATTKQQQPTNIIPHAIIYNIEFPQQKNKTKHYNQVPFVEEPVQLHVPSTFQPLSHQVVRTPSLLLESTDS